jgi:hypothetical protein
MTAATAIASAIAAGITMEVDGERLVLSAPQRPDDRLLDELRREKPEIVEYLRGLAAWTDEDWQALFDERAGIMEFDGGFARAEAEAAAAEAEEVARLRTLVGPSDE